MKLVYYREDPLERDCTSQIVLLSQKNLSKENVAISLHHQSLPKSGSTGEEAATASTTRPTHRETRRRLDLKCTWKIDRLTSKGKKKERYWRRRLEREGRQSTVIIHHHILSDTVFVILL